MSDREPCGSIMQMPDERLPDRPSSGMVRALARNVLANWAGHTIFIVGGFLMPRLINSHLGSARLGVWDLGWSFVSYVSLLTLGITASTNRYVARHCARQDWAGLSRSVVACMAIFIVTGAVAALCTLGAVGLLPALLDSSKLAEVVVEARWVVLFLGLAAAFQMPLSVFGGIVTGYQRYDLVALIESGVHAFLLVAIAVILHCGRGLAAASGAVLLAEVVTGVLKYFLARKLCPELRLSWRLIRWRDLMEVAVFGWKLFLERGARVLLYQTSNMLLVFALGPASLAIYARSNTLVQHGLKLMYHFGRVFTPIASRMDALGDFGGLAELVISATRQSLLVTLPGTAVLVVLGGPLLQVWMGREFAAPAVLILLALGHSGAMAHCASYNILLGLNRHGAAGLASLLTAVGGAGAAALFLLVFGWGTTGVASAVGGSVAILNFLVIPILVARSARIPVGRYFVQTVPGALVLNAPFWLVLGLVQYGSALPAGLKIVVGLCLGTPVLGGLYWRFALLPSLRARIVAALVSACQFGNGRCRTVSRDGSR